MLFNRKAQGLSFNVIVVMVIALIVLVVVSAVFMGQIGSLDKNLDECPKECKPASDCLASSSQYACAPGSTQSAGRTWLSNEQLKCCLIDK